MRKLTFSAIAFVILALITACASEGSEVRPAATAPTPESSVSAPVRTPNDSESFGTVEAGPTSKPATPTPPNNAPSSGADSSGTTPSEGAASASAPAAQESDDSGSDGRMPGLDSLPPCDDSNKFSVSPIDPDAYEVIVPLGLLTIPQHVQPTSHIYYHIVSDDSGDRGQRTPKVANVRAPGDVRILGINLTESNGGPRGNYTDYDITFAPCRDRMFVLIHVSTLSPELTHLQETTKPDRCNEYGSSEGRYRFCTSTVQLDVSAGTLLGTTGGKVSAALDLEAYDFSAPPLAYANPSRYVSSADNRLYVGCPLDWFTDDLWDAHLSRMGGINGHSRTIAPLCGEVMQDVPGTAQGNWFAVGSSGGTDWQSELALVHDHVDPTRAAISVGGVVMEQGLWLFTAENNGQINREFSQVTPDDGLYCYHGAISNEGGVESPFPGRLLLSMPGASRLLLERQDGECDGDWELVEPVEYLR